MGQKLKDGALVGRWLADLIDDDEFGDAFGRLQFEAQLFLEHGEERRVGRVLSFFGSPFDLEIKVSFEAGVVLDRTACLAAESGGDVGHRHIRNLHGGPRAVGVRAHVGLRVRRAWLEAGAQFSGFLGFEPVDARFFLLAMELELEAVFEEREDELLELLRGGDLGAVDSGRVDVERLVVGPGGRAGDAVIVRAEGDADEGADGGSGGNKTSAREDLAI